MVKLLLGRSGTGKSAAILQTMAQTRDAAQILIVPEQYSHLAERSLCAAGGNTVSLHAEVLTFTRLASRVFAAAGGLAQPVMDAGGRLLCMCLAARRMAPSLKVYKKPDRQSALLTGLLGTLDECKSYRVTPQALLDARELLGGATGDKLGDLGLIFNAYDALCQEVGADPRDKLTRLAQALTESHWCAGKDVYLDGFTDFTPQEGLVIGALMSDARNVTVALTCDHLEEDEGGLGIFSPARRTAAYLQRLAGEARAPVEAQTRLTPNHDQAPALLHLERELFADDPKPLAGRVPVRRLAAPDPRREVEWTCGEILRLVREEGYRFRDVAVTARDLSGYEGLCQSIFARYGIPLFLSRAEDILQKPVMTLITAALDAVSGGYAYEDMFRYLKTGLGALTDEETDRLENYVLTWNVKGGKWTEDAPWHMHPGGYGQPFTPAVEEEVARLDALRRRVIAPLETLRRCGAATGRDWAIALYDFLEAIDLPGNLTRRVEALRARGELTLAEEYAQLWDILTGALESAAGLLSEETMDLDTWARLFPMMLSQYQVAAIPVSLDRVTASGCTRLGYQSFKAVFFLGCHDKLVPLCAPSPGLLTDADRSALLEAGLSLAPRTEDKLHREMTICYETCAIPTRRLYLTYPTGADGEERMPSFLLGRVGLIFPDMPVERADDPDPRLQAPEPALELARERPELWDALDRAGYGEQLARLTGEERRGRLSPAGTAALYGGSVPMSASRMDLFRSCHFADFMRYGLRAQPRTRAGFDAPEYGTFVHAILEDVVSRWTPDMGEGKARTLTREAMERYLRETLGGLEDKSARFRYLFRRLWDTVERLTLNVLDELSRSQFTPAAFELGFGARRGDRLPPVEVASGGLTVRLSGIVDRVDCWERDGRKYLRVVDYKTGRKNFDFTDIYHGMGLQMLIYLFTLREQGTELFGMPTVPAGVLYLPAREALVQGRRDMSEETRQALADKELTRHGLLLDDPQVLGAMEQIFPGEKPRFLPVRTTKDGGYAGDSLASAQRLELLDEHVRRVLREVAGELAQGKISADPYWRGPEANACVWCEYRAACQFQEGFRGERCRRQKAIGAKEFWARLEGGDGHGLPTDG